MLREHLFDKRAPADPLFRWRGGEISRLEALSDAVFALTLTLIFATTQVPETFPEIWNVFLDVPVLAVCFTFLVLLWYDHYRFFRRYGLEDAPTTALNLLLLFLVLVYAYPLRFLFSFLWRALVIGTADAAEFFPPMSENVPFAHLFENAYMQSIWMMYLYGIGCASVFGVLFLMHWRAYRLREQLELDDLELALTRGSLRSHGISGGIAVLSIAVAATVGNSPIAGMVYAPNGPLHVWNGWLTATRTDRLKKQPISAVAAAPSADAPLPPTARKGSGETVDQEK